MMRQASGAMESNSEGFALRGNMFLTAIPKHAVIEPERIFG
jgi:hypothetical protein